MYTKCSTPLCPGEPVLQLLGNHPLCRKCGDEKNRKSRIRSAKRRASGHYAPSILARRHNAKKKLIELLAHFLVDNPIEKSIALSLEADRPLNDPRPRMASEWASLRNASTLHGYPQYAEAVEALTTLLA